MYKCKQCGEEINHNHYQSLYRNMRGKPCCPICDSEELDKIGELTKGHFTLCGKISGKCFKIEYIGEKIYADGLSQFVEG